MNPQWMSKRHMTGRQFEAALASVGLGVGDGAWFLGISERTLQRYLRDEQIVPVTHALLLQSLAAQGIRVEVPNWGDC